ncbi:MAG: IclR family transcriptional regulator [Haloechinothrix sp.]
MSGDRSSSATARVFALVGHVAAGGDTANLSELSRATDVNRVTAMRVLADLEHEGVLERGNGGGHRIGLAFLRLACQALRSEDLTSIGGRVLGELSAELQLSAYLVLPDNDHALYLLRRVPTSPLVSNIAIGSRVPAHLTTAGRVLLLAHPADELVELLGPEPLAATTPQSPTTYRQLEGLLDEARARGCAWSHAGFEPDIDSCAAPVIGGEGTPIAAVSVAGPPDDLRASEERERFVEASVKRAARQLSDLLQVPGAPTF